MAEKVPVTNAIRMLRKHKVAFEPFLYRYEEKGGTRASADHLGVQEHEVIKTLVFEDEKRQPLIVLMHGDKEVSAKALARLLGKKAITPCKPDVAQKHSGYMVGGTSPFGTRKAMSVYMEKTVADLPQIWINGGKRGFLVRIDPADAVKVLGCQLVEAATDR